MPITRDVDAEYLLGKLQKHTPSRAVKYRAHARTSELQKSITEPVPRFRMQSEGIKSDIALRLLEQELDLDGQPDLNLASFVNTHVDDAALKLATLNLTKNLADSDEYPALMSIHQRCVAMLSDLWNVPKGEVGVGTATTGSSEAIHLGGLAMKRRWEEAQKQKGRDITGVRPNIIMGANAQVALEKFARYFDVDARILPVHADSLYSFSLEDLKENLDENTIGVFAIFGSTFTGHYQDVAAISKLLDDYEARTGNDVSIHVDGASGALVAPFCTPSVVWDFRLPRVRSINTSGHKFGLTTAGCGWILWRDEKFLPKSLVFVLDYLGGSEETYTLNFSRPGFPVLHQYFNFVRLGKDGYKDVHGGSLANARLLATFLEATGYFEVLSDIHRKKGVHSFSLEHPDKIDSADHEYYNPGLPVVAFGFSKEFREKFPMIPQQALASLLRTKGFIVPNYRMPEDEQDIEVLRVVVRASVSIELLDRLMEEIVKDVQRLMNAVEGHEVGDTQNQKLYNTILKITEPSGEMEHPDSWDEAGKETKDGRKILPRQC